MANGQIYSRIKFKRDTSANWTSADPIILNGEIILVDTQEGELRAKIGDGIKTYTQLPFSDEIVRNLVVSHNNSETAHENMHWIKATDEELVQPPSESINADYLNGHTSDEFAMKTQLDSYALKTDLNDYSLKSELNNYALKTDLNNYATSSELSNINSDVTSLESSKLDKTGGTLTGILTAQSNTNYTTKQVRNIFLSTSQPSSSSGSNGDIWIVYEA